MNDRDPAVEIVLRKFFTQRSRLKTITRISALLSGFSTAALVEFSVDKSPSPPYVLSLFTTVTCSLIGVHFLALMIATCIQPSVDFISSEEKSAERIEFLTEHAFSGTQPYMKIAWLLSTYVGTILFLVDVALIVWIQFESVQFNAAVCGVVVSSLGLFLFIIVAYRLNIVMSNVSLDIRRSELERMRQMSFDIELDE